MPENADKIRRLIRQITPRWMLDLHKRRWQQRQERREDYIVREFHKIYYARLLHKAFWLGVSAFKCPLDCWVYQEIILRTEPEIIVETGVCYGGSTLYLASILDLVGKGSLIGIDIDLSQVHEKVWNHPRVTFIKGNSVDPAILQEVKQKAKGKRTMVVLD